MSAPRASEPHPSNVDGVQNAEGDMFLPIKDWDDWKSNGSRSWWSKRISFRALAVLLLLSLVTGFCGGSGVLRVVDAFQAAKDAKGQVAFIEAQLRGGDITSTESLTTIQTHLSTLHYDIVRLQADIPMESAMANVPGAGGIIHVLNMAQDFVAAGQYAIDAALIIVPSFKDMLHSVGSSTTTTTNSKTAPPPAITSAQIQRVADDVNLASTLVQAGIVERAHVSDSSLQTIGLGSMAPLLHKLDGYTPKIDLYLSDAHTLVGALPDLLGLSKPTNLLLFNMDSDELRPTGGFLGNYAVLTLSGGRLQNGVHLRDIRLLDCPPNGADANCRVNPLPSQYAWFPYSQQIFDVRDSNLDPNFPTAASLAIHLAHDLEGAPALNGVIAMTPALIESILKVTGSIKVASFGVTVTADNLQDVIHYYHILAQYCLDGAQAYDAQCAKLTSASSGSGTTQRKAFDSELGSTLLHTVGSLSSHQQGAVVKVILAALQTKDLQVYFADPKLEAVLTSLNADGAVRAPAGDSLDVVDTNISATYVNGDIQEQVTDNVVLDAHGTATHTMTITYKFPIVNHLWSTLYPLQGGYWGYYDVVRAIVPKDANIGAPSGCAPVDSPENNHAVAACAFTLTRSDQPCGFGGCVLGYNYATTATLHFRWSVPHAAVQSGTGMRYSLLFQKQAGTHITFTVTVTAPGQSAIQAQIPTQTPATVSVKSSNRSVQFTGTLMKDTELSLDY